MHQKIWNKNFLILTLSNFLIFISYYSIISSLPLYISNELNAPKSLVGLALAAYTIASVFIRPFSGFALDRFGRKHILWVALFLYAIMYNGYLLATSMTLIIILRLIHGLTWGITTISGSTVTVDVIPAEKRGEGLGYYGLSTTMGMALGPVLGMFISHHWGYSSMFFSGFCISIVGFLITTFISFPKSLPIKNQEQLAIRNLFDRRSMIPSLNLMILMAPYGCLLSFIALYGTEIGIVNASSFFLVYAFGISLSRFLSGKIFDHNGPATLITECILLLAIGFPILALYKNPVGFYIAAFIIGCGNGVIFPVFQSMVNNIVSVERRGVGNSTLFTALDLGMGFGMLLSGIMVQHFSMTVAFLVCSVIYILGLLLFRKVVVPHYNRHNLYPHLSEKNNPILNWGINKIQQISNLIHTSH
ncbi:MAG: MFS transporter [Bacteroidota bacterium]|nr:MFS transporter [Bacteroidota bacterium]